MLCQGEPTFSLRDPGQKTWGGRLFSSDPRYPVLRLLACVLGFWRPLVLSPKECVKIGFTSFTAPLLCPPPPTAGTRREPWTVDGDTHSEWRNEPERGDSDCPLDGVN